MVRLNHLQDHFTRDGDPKDRWWLHAMWGPNALISVAALKDARGDWNTGSDLAAARARLMK
jgi:hypothetical protein